MLCSPYSEWSIYHLCRQCYDHTNLFSNTKSCWLVTLEFRKALQNRNIGFHETCGENTAFLRPWGPLRMLSMPTQVSDGLAVLLEMKLAPWPWGAKVHWNWKSQFCGNFSASSAVESQGPREDKVISSSQFYICSDYHWELFFYGQNFESFYSQFACTHPLKCLKSEVFGWVGGGRLCLAGGSISLVGKRGPDPDSRLWAGAVFYATWEDRPRT